MKSEHILPVLKLKQRWGLGGIFKYARIFPPKKTIITLFYFINILFYFIKTLYYFLLDSMLLVLLFIIIIIII